MTYREKAIKLWAYLADYDYSNCADIESDAKRDAYADLGFKEDKNYCPACEDALSRLPLPVRESYCDKCTMRGHWPALDGGELEKCIDDDSCYLEWCETGEHADKILKALKEHYK